MNCPNCGSYMDKSDVQCVRCGWLNKKSPINNKKAKVTEDPYLKAYVGKNLNDFKNKDVNIPFIILGPIYYFYRRMYIKGFIYLAFQNLLLLILIKVSFTNTFIILILINFLVSIKVNKSYLNFAEDKINHINKKYDDFTSTQRLMICEKKGKGDYLFVLIAILLESLLIFIFSIFYSYYIDLFENKKTNNKETIEIKENKTLVDLATRNAEGIIKTIEINYMTDSSIKTNQKYEAKTLNTSGITIKNGFYEINNSEILLTDVEFDMQNHTFICSGSKNNIKCNTKTTP